MEREVTLLREELQNFLNKMSNKINIVLFLLDSFK